ncbi:hypothetical protein CVT25_012538 [Psilocybe cyanescens]|uniref:CxC2-like cysteine cluster KDZ transposase-associated domain-containing protein n=1 Tax=Psilocybe cyanescens TaxID=93625 RepID=A0A409X863_PSICY|nr:hypothetical protein CVT25_012538 [Psilocybe cyanescens]
MQEIERDANTHVIIGFQINNYQLDFHNFRLPMFSKKHWQINAREADFYHDPIPVLGDFDIIHASEGIQRTIGGKTRTIRVELPPQCVAGAWEQVTTWAPPDDDTYALEPNGDWFDEAVVADVMVDLQPQCPAEKKNKKAQSLVSKRPNVVWKMTYRQTYLDEILRWAGRGDFRQASTCPDCVVRSVNPPNLPAYRCRECFNPDLTCQDCCLRRHRLLPFHKIQQWTSSCFVDVSLRTLGLKLQLNHSGGHCNNPIPCHANMVVLHTNRIHSINIFYCGCARTIAPHLQLLRRRLYPASQLCVKTCASFELLCHLHKLALTTKASTYDFYRCLEKSTTCLGINTPKSRYQALFRMILQWRHLQMLKWAGRAHDVSGAAGTSEGELAVRCPSCPHPGINLPDNWENAPDGVKFLYMMIVCMDANFCLKNQLVSNYSQDPGLGTGWAYMVPRAPYEAYVLSRANDEYTSTCVGFQALAKANNKFSVGLWYTGVGAVVCSRSEMIFPVGVGNLQKGERYSNMDYIFGSILQLIAVHMILISYDIACQWFINLFKRIESDWPEHIKPRPNASLTPAIPKLHEPMHMQADHQVYSLNFIPGVGLSDCKCPEQVWSSHNTLSNATKTQGPGLRQDTLDDHFGFWNWMKYISMGKSLLQRYKRAVAERNIQTKGHRGLSNSLQDDLLKKRDDMCLAWENDGFPKKKKNPYYMKDNGLTEEEVHKELAKREAEYIAQGNTFPHTTTASKFIALGLELEEAQRRIHRLAKGTGVNLTIRQAGSLTEQRNVLSTGIRAWEQLLPIYILGLLQYQTDYPSLSASTNAKDAILYLLSFIPEPHRSCISTVGLNDIEIRLCHAQMVDSLNSVCQILKVKTRMIQFKNKNIRGQRDSTRSTSVIDRVHERTRLSSAKYRAARVAYLALVGPGDWEATFKKLEDRDIRGVGRHGTLEDGQGLEDSVWEEGEFMLFNEVRTRRDGTGETRRTLSWIWTMPAGQGSEDDQDDILRVEWVKSRARAIQAKEEVMLVKEEMWRTLAFLDWKANWWCDCQFSRAATEPKALLEGTSAYALSQANIQNLLAKHF